MSETTGAPASIGDIAKLDLETVGKRSGWFTALGVLLIILGIVAIGAPGLTGIAVNIIVGWLLIVSGVAHIFHAFQTSGWRGVLVQILCGVLYIAVGVVMIMNPIAGLLALTMTALVYFVVSGIFKIVLAVRAENLPQRGWVTLSGILSLVLAIYIGARVPESALWVVGLLFGIEMIFSGWAFVMIAMAARRATREGDSGPSGGSGTAAAAA